MTTTFHWRMLVAALLLVGGALAPRGVAAQDAPQFTLTAVEFSCQQFIAERPVHRPEVRIEWVDSPRFSIKTLTASAHNSSSNWNQSAELRPAGVNEIPYDWFVVDSNRVDKVFVRAVMEGTPERVYEYTAFLPGPCESSASSITGGLVVDAPTEPTVTVTPPSTETPTATATVVPSETASPEVTNTLKITITLPEGVSIEGAPFDLYAAQAAVVFQTQPYRSGVVGPNNTIEIENLLPGTYKLVVTPEGMDPIEAIIGQGDQPLTEVNLVVNADGTVSVEDAASVAPNTRGETGKQSAVSGLPSTGTGQRLDSMGIVVMLASIVSLLIMSVGVSVRLKRN